MTRFKAKCTSYDGEVASNRKILKFFKLITLFPAIVLALLGIILAIVTAVQKSVEMPWLFLIFAVVGVLYFFIIGGVLKSKFKTNNRDIIAKFMGYYKPASTRANVVITNDNKGIMNKVNANGANNLFAFMTSDSMCFITSEILNLQNLELRVISVADRFESIISKDFGELIIPVDDIDNYRDNQMMVRFKDSVLKIDFNHKEFMDNYIPTKDFYFNVNKK